jgi:hypothetical protein
MTAKFKDVVFKTFDDTLVWCEVSARVHTVLPFEVRYQFKAFEAFEEYHPELIYRQGNKKINESSWKKTPKEARNDLEEKLGSELKKENIVFEKKFSISIPIVDELF